WSFILWYTMFTSIRGGRPMRHEFHLTVRSTDVDMIGHVNHAKYLEYMEWARFEWLKKLGLSMDELTRRQLLPVVVHLRIDYRKELKLDEQVKIISEPIRSGTKSSVVGQKAFNSRGDLACEAEITWVLIDAKRRKAVELPSEVKSLLQSV